METVLKADIFFFVATLAVVVITVLLIIAIRAFIKMLHRIKNFVDTIEADAVGASETVREMAEQVRESLVFNFIFARRKRKKKS